VGVNSGTAALFIALEALGIGPDDEVIVPPLTFFATISSVLYHKARPVFADIDLDDLCLSPQSVESKITKKTKAIIPVHLFGAPAKMDELSALAAENTIALLEDCAQAHGTEYREQKVGGLGKAGAFSFFATKHMTTGEGGMITTNDPEVAEKCKTLRNHGMSSRDDHVCLGFNNRMTEIEAAMGLVQLEKLEKLNAKRIQHSDYLIQAAAKLSWAHMPLPAAKCRHTYFWCPLMIDEEKTDRSIEDLKQHLAGHNIGFRHRYREPLYKQPLLKELGMDYTDLSLPNAEAVAGKIIGLPNHPKLNRQALDRIVSALNTF